jgi:hypothetical protein
MNFDNLKAYLIGITLESASTDSQVRGALLVTGTVFINCPL